MNVLFSAKNAVVGVANQSVVVISDDEENSDVICVETTIDKKEEEEHSNASGYLAEPDSSASSSISFGSPPDYTKYLALLYSGKSALIPEFMRPPPRDNTSTPKKEDGI